MSIFSIFKILRPLRLGKVKDLNGQYIETKFILFVPVCSYFVIEKTNTEIKIPLHKFSLKAFFIPFAFIMSGFLFFALMLFLSMYFQFRPTETFIDYIPITITAILIIIGFYFLYRTEKLDEFEVKKRQIIQKAVNFNFLPEWLNDTSKKEILNKLSLNENWITNIEQNNWDDFEKYYTAMYFTYSLNPSDKNKLLYEKLERKLNIIKL